MLTAAGLILIIDAHGGRPLAEGVGPACRTMTILPIETPSADDRFSLVGQMEILSLLQSLLFRRQAVSVQYGAHREALLTSLLSVHPEGMVFDLGLDSESNQRLLASRRLLFSCQPDGILVRFHCDAPQRVVWDGEAACQVALPQRITRLQRREYFRVIAPIAKPITVSLRIPDLDRLELVIHDLSVGGAGLTLPEGAQLPIGTTLAEAQFRVARNEPIKVNLAFKHFTPISHGMTKPVTRVGVAFQQLALKEEASLQRWIIQLDQERRKFEQRLY